MKKISLLFCFMLLTACGILYRPDVQQGNIVTQDMLDDIHPGMSSQQVRYLLGNPVLSHSFDVNRWDYIYTYRKSTNPTDVKRVTLYFSNDQLQRISPTVTYQIKN